MVLNMDEKETILPPLILVTAEDGYDAMGDDHFVVSHRNTNAVAKAGGIPATPLDIRCVKEYAAFGDALFLTDGPGVYTACLGGVCPDVSQLKGFSRTRDDLEIALAEAFLAQGKPVLGIGRGLDILAAARGGSRGQEPQEQETVEDRISTLVRAAGSHTGISGLPPMLLEGGPAIDRFHAGAGTVLNKTYPRAFAANGALPLLVTERRFVPNYPQLFAGLVLTGSQCYTPWRERFRELCLREMERQELDSALFRAFAGAKKPVFGICLGLQRINLFLGGTLKQDFKFEEGVEHMFTKHTVHVAEGSILFQLFGPSFLVNSRHNVRIDALAPGLVATAHSPDGVIEACEHEVLPIHGLQWHPERMRGEIPEPPDGPAMDPLFREFARQCIQGAEFQGEEAVT